MNSEIRVFPDSLVYVPPVRYGARDLFKAAATDPKLRQICIIILAFLVGFLAVGVAQKNLFFILAGCGFALVAIYGLKLSYEQDIWFARLAAANGLGVIDSTTPVIDIKGVLAGLGRNQYYKRGLADPAGRWMIAEYRFTTGSGKSSRENAIEIIRMKLPKPLPNVMLDTTSNDFLGISNMGNQLAGHQRLQLEGDFNKYFTVYVPEGYERDILYFLTPELMQFLVEYGTQYDYEIIGDELLIYGSIQGIKPQNFMSTLQQRMQLASKVYAQLVDNIRLYNDHRVANDPQGSPQQIAVQGQVLKRRKTGQIVTVVVTLIFFVFWLWGFGFGIFSALGQ